MASFRPTIALNGAIRDTWNRLYLPSVRCIFAIGVWWGVTAGLPALGTQSLPRCRSVSAKRKVGRCEGSEGVQACSLGRKPQIRRRPLAPKPRRATAVFLAALICRRPFGALGSFEIADLGLTLTPQATCRCPLRGKSRNLAKFAQAGRARAGEPAPSCQKKCRFSPPHPIAQAILL
jgi:hypothetical protein